MSYSVMPSPPWQSIGRPAAPAPPSKYALSVQRRLPRSNATLPMAEWAVHSDKQAACGCCGTVAASSSAALLALSKVRPPSKQKDTK